MLMWKGEFLANKEEFHEFNFGYDVVKDGERVLSGLL